MLEHGGRLRRAAQRYGIAHGDWLDLSTGISPWSWLDENRFEPSGASWMRLPEPDDALAEAARAYYGAAALPVAGSQAAIQALPQLRAPSRVGVLSPSYAEHAQAWRAFGHCVQQLDPRAINSALDALDVLVLVQPNNPDGTCLDRASLLRWHSRLSARGGWLVVDEAFVDAHPQSSLAAESWRSGLIVLRSLGKFFGLAGARVGFVLAEPALREALDVALGPWMLAGPSRELAARVLLDRDWQARQRTRLAAATRRLASALMQAGLAPHGATALFQWVRSVRAAERHEALAAQGILTRLFDQPASLRFGLPGAEPDWQRLHTALQETRSLTA